RVRERLVRYQQDRRAKIADLVRAGAATVAELTAAESAAAEAEVGLLQTRAAAARVCSTRPRRQYCRGRSRLARERATFNDPYIALRRPRPRYSGQAGGVRVPWRAVDRSGADRQPARGRLRVSEVRKPANSRHDSDDPFSGRNADAGAHSRAADTHAAHACGPRGPVRAAPDDGGTKPPAEGKTERQPAGSGVTGIGALP